MIGNTFTNILTFGQNCHWANLVIVYNMTATTLLSEIQPHTLCPNDYSEAVSLCLE